MRLLLAVPDAGLEGPLLGRFARADAGTTVVRRCVDLADLLAAAASVPADVAVVALGLRHLDRDAVASLHARGLRVVVVTEGQPGGGHASDPVQPRWGADTVVEADPDTVLRALRSGGPVRSPVSDGGELLGGSRVADVPGGRLVAVWGPAGAPGRTTVAVTVADESARLGVPTLLVDADTYGASVALRLGLLDDLSGLAAACRQAAAGRLTPQQLAGSAVTLDSGLRVLTGLARPDRWAELRPAALDEVWTAARGLVPLTVVDCGFGLERSMESQFDPGVPVRDGATVATVATADTVLCVGRIDPVGLVRLLRDLPALRDAAPTAELVAVLVGSGRRRTGADDAADARRLLAERADLHDVVVVPDDRSGADAALWAGRTLAEAAPASPARLALSELAGRLAGVAPRRARRLRVGRSA